MNKVKECTIIPIKEKIVSKEFKINLKERENITKDETISIVSDTMFKTMFMSEKELNIQLNYYHIF